jgi:hypothetical protein
MRSGRIIHRQPVEHPTNYRGDPTETHYAPSPDFLRIHPDQLGSRHKFCHGLIGQAATSWNVHTGEAFCMHRTVADQFTRMSPTTERKPE